MKFYTTRLAFLLLSLNALGCSLPEPGQLVSISNPPLFRPISPQEVKNVEQAMAAIITICTKDLGLPVVEPLYLHLYKEADSFAAYAVTRGRLNSDVLKFAIGVAEENRFHINMERAKGRPWGAFIKTLAHEYAHIVEYGQASIHIGPPFLILAALGACRRIHAGSKKWDMQL